MRNYLMYTGNRINALTINPSGSSYVSSSTARKTRIIP